MKTPRVILALLGFFAANLHSQAYQYEYTPYNAGAMDPQPSGWPVTDAEKLYIQQAEYLRYPGKETSKNATGQPTGISILTMVAQTPNTQGWGANNSYFDTHQKTIQPILDNTDNIRDSLDIIMVGDSITSQWGGGQMGAWTATWTSNFGSYKAINMGIGGDRTSSVLWRLDHAPFDLLTRPPKVIVLQIGNNNQYLKAQGVPTSSSVQGVVTCLKNLRSKFPSTPIIWLNLFPVTGLSSSTYLKELHDACTAAGITEPASPNYVSNVYPLDLWNQYVSADGVTANSTYFYDGVHPNAAGYQLWADNMKPMITALLNPAVTYNGNGNTGGTAPIDASSPYAQGGTVTVIGNTGSLTKTNYTFAGWNTAADGSGTSYSVGSTFAISNPTTLYAQWLFSGACTLTYNGNGNTGGNVPADSSSPYAAGTTVTVLGNTGGLTKSGSYTFGGWNTAANGSGTTYTAGNTFAIRTPTTLYAQWTYNGPTYTVTYNGNGSTGGSVPAETNSPYMPGVTVTVLGNTGSLSRTNYIFAGWNTAADGSGTSYSAGSLFTISSATTLYAKWTFNGPCTLTYDGNGNTGGTAPTDANSPYTVGATVTVLSNTGNLSKSGNFTFAGWNTAANGSGTSVVPGNNFTVVAPLTLYAQWNSTATYTWTQTAGNTQPWATAGNWLGGVAPTPFSGDTMDFSTVNIAASTTLTLGADRTATIWNFGDTSGAQTWSVASSNKIILAGTAPTICVLQNSLTVNCPITGSAGLTKAGAGLLTLSSSTSAYTGGTFIKEGSLALGTGNDRIPTGSVVTLGDTSTKGTLILGSSGTPRNQTLGGLSSTGLGGNVIGQGAGSTLTLNMSANSTYGGVLGGTGTGNNNLILIKQGNGTLTLSGANTYTGATSLNGGTLVVSGSLANTTVTVGNGATLAGSGNIGGSVIIQNGGHQAFVVATTSGAQATRTISGTLTLDAGHVIDLTSAATSAAGTYTLVTATGGVTGTVGTVNLTGLNGTVSIVGKSLVLTVAAASYYESWKSANSLIGGPTADEDGDGWTNFLEYAFGSNPKASNGSLISIEPTVSDGPTLRFNRRSPEYGGPAMSYWYSQSLSPDSWQEFVPERMDVSGSGEVQDARAVLPATLRNQPKSFFQIRVSQ
ncbi:MAG: InlB B-repeat-containing protein [Candidatus Pacebacteria bacterium]|nr:InlB B-repeat-containing protein [Candidatus Paceibacterota bacterium]